MDAIDKILSVYKNQIIEIDQSPGSDFTKIMAELENILGPEMTLGFIIGPMYKYAKKYNITFITSDDDDDEDDDEDYIDKKIIPKIGYDDDMIKMKYLAGLNESEDEKKSFKKDQVLTFNSEEDRDLALKWLREANNYPKTIKKNIKGKLHYKPEDALSIMFPTNNNLNENIDERKFEGIIEILHRAINKTIPNSRTIKVKDNG
jgi:hypothetical protein